MLCMQSAMLLNQFRLSVSLIPVLYMSTNAHIITLLDILAPGHSIPTTIRKSEGNPLSGGVKYKGWVNFANITFYVGNSTK